MDDLIILVDGSSNQQVRVQNHFKGGDLAISYVQPSDGNAIQAAQFASLLTPLSAGFVAARVSLSSWSPMSHTSASRITMVGATDAVVSANAGTPHDLTPVKLDSSRFEIWNWPSGPGLFDHAVRIEAMDGDAGFGGGIRAGRDVQQLIEAMSRFHPGPGGMPLVDEGAVWNALPLAMSHVTDQPFKPRSAASAF